MPNCAAVESREGAALIGVSISRDAKFQHAEVSALCVSRFSIPSRVPNPRCFVLFWRTTRRIKAEIFGLFEKFLCGRPTFQCAFFRGVVFCSTLRSVFARAKLESGRPGGAEFFRVCMYVCI